MNDVRVHLVARAVIESGGAFLLTRARGYIRTFPPGGPPPPGEPPASRTTSGLDSGTSERLEEPPR